MLVPFQDSITSVDHLYTRECQLIKFLLYFSVDLPPSGDSSSESDDAGVDGDGRT